MFKLSAKGGPIISTLFLLSMVSLGFLLVHFIITGGFVYWYLGWNLFLAWLPVLFVGWLLSSLHKHPWISWRPMLFTTLWLAFLPNSFYLTSDLVHLQDVPTSHLLYDSAMLMSFAVNGLILGYLSLYLVHRQLLKRVSKTRATILVALVLMVCSFALYLGRDLRWNSWDLLVNPAGILFDVSNQFIDPSGHVPAYTTTLMFTMLLGSLYFLTWRLAKLLLPAHRRPE